MNITSDHETKIAETAFALSEYKKYGSEDKALKALLRRKGMEDLDQGTERKILKISLSMLDRAKEMKVKILSEHSKQSVPHLSHEQYEDGVKQMKITLEKEFPKMEVTIKYMIGMIWTMYYLR